MIESTSACSARNPVNGYAGGSFDVWLGFAFERFCVKRAGRLAAGLLAFPVGRHARKGTPAFSESRTHTVTGPGVYAANTRGKLAGAAETRGLSAGSRRPCWR